MAVDATHPGCFVHATRLYAVPSDSGHDVDETRESFADAAAARRRIGVHFDWRAVVGGTSGGLFLVASAWLASDVRDNLALALLFLFGGVVGLVVSITIRWHGTIPAPDPTIVRLPAVEVPGDVARFAPDDATVDELVLWSVLTQRFRAAKAALEALPFETPVIDPTSEGPQDAEGLQDAQGGRAPTGTMANALAETSYVTARHDYAPVAEILGLPLPD